MDIPETLIELVREGRVIPFIGAGFAHELRLPSWDDVLKKLCETLRIDHSYETIRNQTGNDPLQIAEYLYLKSDRKIGPIRYELERMLNTANKDTLLSGAHVELVNLGCEQIYTTNYDDLIETTHRALGIDARSIVLPKDIALGAKSPVQIVKYHGDLRHEDTLVLTESSYYKRLELESPIDLKFRSDILGKSVLFMGYSFRDINIRIIWFKLMEMMKDIPQADRPPSFIIRKDRNATSEMLYAAVGLHTIMLDDDGKGRIDSLGKFLMEVNRRVRSSSSKAASDITQNTRLPRPYLSISVLESIREAIEPIPTAKGGTSNAKDAFSLYDARIRLGFTLGGSPITQLLKAQVNPSIEQNTQALFRDLLVIAGYEVSHDLWNEILDRLEPSSELTNFGFLSILGRQGMRIQQRVARIELSQAPYWAKLYQSPIALQVARVIADGLTREIEYAKTREIDDDLFWLSVAAKAMTSHVVAIDDGRSSNALLMRSIESGLSNNKLPTASEILAELEHLLTQAADVLKVVNELRGTFDDRGLWPDASAVCVLPDAESA